MSKPYMNDVQKISRVGTLGPINYTWTLSDQRELAKAFEKKGYSVLPVTRLDHTATRYDALLCYRDEVAAILEYLFTQRIIVEVEAESSFSVCIIFVYQTSADEILEHIQSMPRGELKEMIK